MPTEPEQPFGGVEYPSIEQQGPAGDPYAPVDYPAAYPPMPPPVYPQPGGGYPPPPPGYPPPGYGAGYPSPYPGYPPYSYDPYQTVKPLGTNGKAIASLITSLAGLVCCGLPSIAGVILGFLAMRETKSTGQEGYGIALAGTIVGGLVITFFVLYLMVAVILGATGFE